MIQALIIEIRYLWFLLFEQKLTAYLSPGSVHPILYMEQILLSYLGSKGVAVTTEGKDLTLIFPGGNLFSLMAVMLEASSKCFFSSPENEKTKPVNEVKTETLPTEMRSDKPASRESKTRSYSAKKPPQKGDGIFQPSDEKSFYTIDSLPLLGVDKIERLRKNIHDSINNPYPTPSAELLSNLAEEYDRHFFKRYLSVLLRERKKSLRFYISPRLTRSAGNTTSRDDAVDIKLSGPILNDITEKGVDQLHDNCSKPLQSRLYAIMTILEHELIHAIAYLSESEGIVNAHGDWFMRVIKDLFGHNRCRHLLIKRTSGEDKTSVLTRETAVVNQHVYYYNHGEKIIGRIIKVNPKRARIILDGSKAVCLAYYAILRPC